MPTNGYEARRGERTQRVDLARTAASRERAQEVVVASRRDLVDAAGQYEVRRMELDRREEARTRFVEENPTVVEGGVQRLAGDIFSGMIKPLSVLTLDVILLAAVAEFAISLAYILPDGEPLPPWMLLPVPLTLQSLETMVGLQIVASSSQQHPRGAARRRAWGWWVVGAMLALVMPAMTGYALQLSLQAKGEVLDAATVMLSIGIITLAFVCHSVMIFSARGTLDGVSHIAGRVRLRALERRIGREQRGVERARSRAWETLPPYSAALDEYRRVHGLPPSALLLARHEADLVNEALGESVVLSPDGDEPRPGEDDALPVQPPPPSAPSGYGGRAAVPAPGEMPGDGGDAEAEAEYLRRILDARLRDRDAEFHV